VVVAEIGPVEVFALRLADPSWLRSTGDWLALASAHTWAFYTIATRDLVRRRPPLAVTFGSWRPRSP